MAEVDALDGNRSIRHYAWTPAGAGADVPVAIFDADAEAVYYYVADGNKNIRRLVDKTGAVVAEYDYDPFGRVVSATGAMADANPFRFSSEYHDNETGLVYYNYRYYHPGLGRWLSRDPIEEQGGVNLYGMVGNNPVNKWDNLGLKKGEVLWVMYTPTDYKKDIVKNATNTLAGLHSDLKTFFTPRNAALRLTLVYSPIQVMSIICTIISA